MWDSTRVHTEYAPPYDCRLGNKLSLRLTTGVSINTLTRQARLHLSKISKLIEEVHIESNVKGVEARHLCLDCQSLAIFTEATDLQVVIRLILGIR
jgi:hypothetical protein